MLYIFHAHKKGVGGMYVFIYLFLENVLAGQKKKKKNMDTTRSVEK